MLPFPVIVVLVAISACLLFVALTAAIYFFPRRRHNRDLPTTDHDREPRVSFHREISRNGDGESSWRQDRYGERSDESAEIPALFSSQENLVQSFGDVDSEALSQPPKKTWSTSFAWTRSLRKAFAGFKTGNVLQRPLYLSSLEALTESTDASSDAQSSHSLPRLREGCVTASILTSILQAPIQRETASRAVSVREIFRTRFNSRTHRPISAPLPLASSRVENWDSQLSARNPPLLRTPITNQTAGAVPTLPIPPPPPVPTRYRLPDSDMGLSSINTTILDDGIELTSSPSEHDFAYPSGCPGPTLGFDGDDDDTDADDRYQVNSVPFTALLPPPPVLTRKGGAVQFGGRPELSLSYANTNSGEASARQQYHPLRLNPIHPHYPKHENLHTAGEEGHSDPETVPGGLGSGNGSGASNERTTNSGVGMPSLLTWRNVGQAGPSVPSSPNNSFRKGHKRQYSVRLPTIPPDMFGGTSSRPGNDAHELDELDSQGSKKGKQKKRAENQNPEREDTYATYRPRKCLAEVLQQGKVQQWKFPSMESADNRIANGQERQENQYQYERYRNPESGPKSSPCNKNAGMSRRSVHSLKGTSMMTIWEEDKDGKMPQLGPDVQGSSNGHGMVEGAQFAHNVQGDTLTEAPSVRIVRDSEVETPFGRNVGLRLSASAEEKTPGSLYDQDGFFKEY